MSTDAGKSRELPRLLVVLVVIATGAATIWAATKAGPLGPYTSWERAQQAVQQVWGGRAQMAPPQMPVQQVQTLPAGAAPQAPPASTAPAASLNPAQPAPSSPAFPLPDDTAARTVGLPGVPTIIWGTPRPHRDRGPCVNCHTVATGDGQRVPTIFSFSAMPHEYRGVCNNCHQISVAGFGGNLIAGVRATEPADPQLQMQGMPNEAEWRGMEVRSVSQGVVITKADGAAARAGVQAGDVVDSINGAPVRAMADFVQVTLNGELQQGTMIARRNGQRLAFELQRSPGAVQRSASTAMLDPAQPQAQQPSTMPQQQLMPQQPSMMPGQQFMPQQQLAPQQQSMMPGQQLAPQQQSMMPGQQLAPQQWVTPGGMPAAPAAQGR